MAQQIYSNCKLWLAQYDLSGYMNALGINDNPDMLDNTVFGNTAKSRKKGLSAVAANHEGLWDGTAEDAIWNDFNATTIPMTISPVTGAEGDPAYSFLAQTAEYSLGGAVGELLKFTVKAENAGSGLVRGLILFNDTKDASSTGTAYELGAITAGQTMYAALHVISASASDTLDVIIQSDNLQAFGDPQTRITFNQVALGAGGGGTYEWQTYAPAAGQTDIWWRIGYTIAGAAPSFTFVVFAGIC